VLDGRAINDNFWVFYGALSNVEYTISVTDLTTSSVHQYANPQGNLASVADTAAFNAAGLAIPTRTPNPETPTSTPSELVTTTPVPTSSLPTPTPIPPPPTIPVPTTYLDGAVIAIGSGSVVAGVQVSASVGDRVGSTVSGSDGTYRIDGLRPGTASVEAIKSGYHVYVNTVNLNAGGNSRVILLNPAP
jgi:hypothetical protein